MNKKVLITAAAVTGTLVAGAGTYLKATEKKRAEAKIIKGIKEISEIKEQTMARQEERADMMAKLDELQKEIDFIGDSESEDMKKRMNEILGEIVEIGKRGRMMEKEACKNDKRLNRIDKALNRAEKIRRKA